MFCPKCGSEAKDGSAFCPKCGAAFNARPTPTIADTASAPAAISTTARASAPQVPGAGALSLSFSGIQIAGIVFAVIALVTALLPWFLTSNSLIQAGNTASAASSFLTMGNYSTAQFEESYTMLSMNDFADDLASYFSTKASGGGTLSVLIPLWAVSLILLVAGVVLFALRKMKSLLIVGAVALLLVAGYYQFGFYGAFVEEGWAVSCMNPILCMVACIAVIVCVVLTKKTKGMKDTNVKSAN